MKFYHKGYGRIYTDKEENIETIKSIIKSIDEYEFDYLPNNLIAVFEGKIERVYNHKFSDLDLNVLLEKCWGYGIHIFITMSASE